MFEQTILDFADAYIDHNSGLEVSDGASSVSSFSSSRSSSSRSSLPLFDNSSLTSSSRSSLDWTSDEPYLKSFRTKLAKSMSQCLVSDETRDWSEYYSGMKQFVSVRVPEEEIIEA